jgi:hypothetical protein
MARTRSVTANNFRSLGIGGANPPRNGTKLRAIYDLLRSNPGEPVNCEASRAEIDTLTDFYGLHIAQDSRDVFVLCGEESLNGASIEYCIGLPPPNSALRDFYIQFMAHKGETISCAASNYVIEALKDFWGLDIQHIGGDRFLLRGRSSLSSDEYVSYLGGYHSS